MNELTERLRKLAEHWRSEAKRHDEKRLQLRLAGLDGMSAEYERRKADAQCLLICAYELLREVGPA